MNNYIQITIDGKEYGAKLGLAFVERVAKGENINDGNILSVVIPRLMFYAFEYGAYRAGKTLDIKVEDVFDFVDDVGVHSEPVLSFQKTLFESMLINIDDAEANKIIKDSIKDIEGKLKTLSKKK